MSLPEYRRLGLRSGIDFQPCGACCTHLDQRQSGRWSLVYKDARGNFQMSSISYATKASAEEARRCN